MDWDLDEWLPLIADRRFLPWLVREPDDEAAAGARAPSATRIHQLEELWKARPTADFGDLDAPGAVPEDDVLPVLLKYQDGYHYQNLLAPLVKLEADHDREQCEAQAREDVTVRWDRGLSKRAVDSKILKGTIFQALLAKADGAERRAIKRLDVQGWCGGGG